MEVSSYGQTYSADGINVEMTGTQIGLTPAANSIIETTPTENAQQSIEIIELQANASVSPLTHDSIISDTFSDATGYNNSVNTGNTTALFSTNKYIRSSAGGGVNASGFSYGTTSDNGKNGLKITAKLNCTITKITKDSQSNATTCYIRADDGTELATASFSGNDATFSQAIVNGLSYHIECDKATALYTPSYLATGQTYPVVCNNLNYVGGSVNASDNTQAWNIASITTSGTAIDECVQIDLPAITGTITHTELVVNDADAETGTSITYKLIDNASNQDDALAVNIQNALISCDGTKITNGKIEIQLHKGAAGTSGKPSVKSYALKLWKA